MFWRFVLSKNSREVTWKLFLFTEPTHIAAEMNTYTLVIESENVYSALGVALSVTGIAQVTCGTSCRPRLSAGHGILPLM